MYVKFLQNEYNIPCCKTYSSLWSLWAGSIWMPGGTACRLVPWKLILKWHASTWMSCEVVYMSWVHYVVCLQSCIKHLWVWNVIFREYPWYMSILFGLHNLLVPLVKPKYIILFYDTITIVESDLLSLLLCQVKLARNFLCFDFGSCHDG